MKAVLLFSYDEFMKLIKKADIILPQIISSILPIIIFIYGFSKMGYLNYSKVISSGFLFSSLMGISISSVIFLTVDLSIGNLLNLVSYPLSIRTIFIIKFFISIFISFILAIVTFLITNILLYKIYDTRIFLILFAFLCQIIMFTGFFVLLSLLLKDITKLGLIVSISSTILMYFSPVYFPLKIYPDFVRNIIYFNPMTFSILFLRTIIDKSINYKYLLILVPEAFLYLLFGFLSLKQKIDKLR